MIQRLLTGVAHTGIDLADYQINEIVDQRHTGRKWQVDHDDYQSLVSKLVAADLVVFATPIYWYGVSGLLKNFIDRWSESLATDKDFKVKMMGKRIIILLVGSDDPRVKGQPIIAEFHYICDFLGWKFTASVIANGHRPLDVVEDGRAMATLGRLNQRLQTINQEMGELDESTLF
ncbi:flavin reductase [Lentilactobacillus kisonensis F0435]|nr:flavin reductase [Lentilactobacillus kisonensis F0435]